MRGAATDGPSLRASVAEAFHRACFDARLSHARVAEALDRTHRIVDSWATPGSDKSLPVWALASRDAIPDAVFDALVDALRVLRGEPAVGITAESASVLFHRSLGDAVAALARGTRGGRIVEDLGTIRRAVADVVRTGSRLGESLAREGGR